MDKEPSNSERIASELAIVRLKKELEDLYLENQDKKDNPFRALLLFLISFILLGLFVSLIYSIKEYGLTLFKICCGLVLLLADIWIFRKIYFLLSSMKNNSSRDLIIAKETELQKHRSIVANK